MDKRIETIEHDSDGWWFYLKPGFQNGCDPGTHAIVETTKREALAKVSMIRPCDCAECRRLIAKV